ncbi:hypothetical protein AVT69_gp118 [Pseudomonas phage PhiPA3]|uniref:Uncharacterized protein 119 n=1 Tax=Pseudomonas phage PhiPA3 TaxID=998086 RepID=F8SJZ3_BPPA3|nr:hypothetical protein AVT69_gp118 [Pseudomonas phage PhiPA3]AEH03543.1 hypothetical protein [Pseudomonas phage PhiPA3]
MDDLMINHNYGKPMNETPAIRISDLPVLDDRQINQAIANLDTLAIPSAEQVIKTIDEQERIRQTPLFDTFVKDMVAKLNDPVFLHREKHHFSSGKGYVFEYKDNMPAPLFEYLCSQFGKAGWAAVTRTNGNERAATGRTTSIYVIYDDCDE